MSSYTNPFQVKLPLLRVANPASEECQKEFHRFQESMQEAEKQKREDMRQVEQENQNYNVFQKESAARDLKSGQAKTMEQEGYQPALFNFNHVTDPEMTPRKNWQAKIVHLDSLLEFEKEKAHSLE
jgi:hypothetical protein